MLYKQTREEYVLTDRDKLVLTYQNGELMLLINNTIKLEPQSLNISTEGFEVKNIGCGNTKQVTTRMDINCEVES